MKHLALLAFVGLVASAGPAFAGRFPGPEMGDGAVGLILIAAVGAAYLLLRYIGRKKRKAS